MKKVYTWQDKVVLVVEDDTSSLMLLKAILSKTGAKILVAEDGDSAVVFFQNNTHIDLVLMDIRLKGLNGLQATQQIKHIKPSTPVIAQTACVFTEDKEKCFNAGCNAYITKPIEPNLLLETMDYYFKMGIAQEMFADVVYSN